MGDPDTRRRAALAAETRFTGNNRAEFVHRMFGRRRRSGAGRVRLQHARITAGHQREQHYSATAGRPTPIRQQKVGLHPGRVPGGFPGAEITA